MCVYMCVWCNRRLADAPWNWAGLWRTRWRNWSNASIWSSTINPTSINWRETISSSRSRSYSTTNTPATPWRYAHSDWSDKETRQRNAVKSWSLNLHPSFVYIISTRKSSTTTLLNCILNFLTLLSISSFLLSFPAAYPCWLGAAPDHHRSYH